MPGFVAAWTGAKAVSRSQEGPGKVLEERGGAGGGDGWGRWFGEGRSQKAILFLRSTFEVILIYFEEVDRYREIPNWLQGFL